MNKLREIFHDANIADTRHFSLEDALAQCHRAFSHMDTYNRQQVIERMPFVAQCARFYGLNMNACNTFEHDNIEMPEDVDARVREILDNI
jgi:hypothetical protein